MIMFLIAFMSPEGRILVISGLQLGTSREAVGGPVGGGSLSSWKEPEVKKKEDGEPDNFSSADEAQSKLKEPEDNKN